MKLFLAFCFAALLTFGGVAQTTPPGAKVAPAKPADAKNSGTQASANKKEEAHARNLRRISFRDRGAPVYTLKPSRLSTIH